MPMSCMPDMVPTLLVTALAPCTGKFIKNGLSVFEREEHLLQSILHLVFKFSQSLEIALGSYVDEKPKNLMLKGLRNF